MKRINVISRHRPLMFIGIIAISILTFIFVRQFSQHSITKVTSRANPVASSSSVPSTTAETTDVEMSDKTDSDAKIIDIFGVRSWQPPPPASMAKPGPPPLPPLPQAPPLPFHLLGKINDPERGMTFMLTRGGEVLLVEIGDTIENLYRVDKFNNGQLEFVYQPLRIRQTLFVGSDL